MQPDGWAVFCAMSEDCEIEAVLIQESASLRSFFYGCQE
jgi:hypothetical protein